MWSLFVTVLLTGCVHGLPDFHEDLSPEDLSKYFGIQSRKNIPEYEIVSPKHKYGSPPTRSSFSAKKPPLRYELAAFGEEFQLQLEHNDDLIAPGCLVHTSKSNGTKTVLPCPTREDDCYYQGTSLTHNGSQASLSTCDGLHGLIRLPDRGHDVWVVPVDHRHVSRAKRSADVTNPHIVYRRAVTDRSCAMDGLPEVGDLLNQAETVGRRRRQAGGKFVELLLVADTSMHRHYGDRVSHYLLTVVNVANRILSDPSIGTPIQLAVVKIQILEEDQAGLVITENVDQTLDSFCEWQEQFNPASDSNPQHYDTAALFTRLDLAHGGISDTTGFAAVGGMCRPRVRCTINEDDGLGVGVTLAHETGHLLGMGHDGSGSARSCPDGKNVMSSQGGGEGTAMMWSACSAAALQQFLRTSVASCLNDRPLTALDIPKDLPGVLYDGNEQCELYMGEGSSVCEGTSLTKGDECTHLVCYDPRFAGTCTADSVPRMDGTMCGDRKYCLRGQCVDIGPNGPRPRDGGWSAWDSQWSACSRSCGGGVRFRRRRCDNPKPRLGGRDCPGSEVMAELCNVQACSTSQKDFKAEQCAQTDGEEFNGRRYHWVPVDRTGHNACELRCRVDGQRTESLRRLDNRSWFRDGTVCPHSSASFGRCIRGKCVELGCDGKSDSRYRYDKCGVCGGQGNACRRLTGTYNQGQKQQYVTFLTIPKGGTSVIVTNKNRFTQMSLKVGGQRMFNKAGGMTDLGGTYYQGGVEAEYKTGYGVDETIIIPGPLPVPVELQVWRQFGDHDGYQGVSPQIDYEYHVPNAPNAPTDYVWRAQNGACSKSCGGGVYERAITCTRRSDGAQVDDHFCDILQKPHQTGSACNNQACPPRWRTGQYGQCSKTCGGGTQTRSIECVQERDGVEEVVSQSQCPANQRPVTSRDCNVNDCGGMWVTTPWSACSMTCGRGVQTRTVSCVSDSVARTPVHESQCKDTKPVATQQCVVAICSPTITGDACKDVDSGCAGYGDTMCQQYESFARTNCMKYCAFCATDGTVSGVSCEDKNAQCSEYGQSVCTGQYAEWARDNCAKFCGHCSGGGGTTGGGSTGGGEACADKNSDCASYGQSVCTGQYAAWAEENCAKMCGHCGGTGGGSGGGGGGGTSTGTDVSAACADKNNDCASYGQSVCTGQYAAWAEENCAKMCGHCGGSGGGGSTGTVSGGSCEDKNAQCSEYGQSVCTGQYAQWARDNCAKFCGLCGAGGGASSGGDSCEDTADNCEAYGASVCTQYADWAAQNCQKYCNKCGGRRKRSVVVPPPPPPPSHTAPCNTVHTKPEGSLSLTGQPLERECSHVIVAPEGAKIRLSFTALLISCEDGDWLEVRDENTKPTGDKEGQDLCDQTAPVEMTTVGNVVTVRMTQSIPGHGYNLTYKVVNIPHALTPSCDMLLTDPSGSFSSPSFPGNYPDNMLCSTSIVAPPGTFIEISFSNFELYGEGGNCTEDNVMLFDEEYGVKDVFCGSQPDLGWQSKGSRVKVIFSSDGENSGQGFYASYRFIMPW